MSPSCRWCREPVVRGVPCRCERAQEEWRRVMWGENLGTTKGCGMAGGSAMVGNWAEKAQSSDKEAA